MNETVSDLIQIAEREIRRDSEDLARLKQRYPGYDFVRVDTPRLPVLDELEVEILKLINNGSSTEWTSRSVLTALRLGGYHRLPNKVEAAMNAIAAALVSLRDAGKITRVHEGRGRDPHRYTTKLEEKNEEPAEAGS